MLKKKRIIISVFLLLLLISIPLTISLLSMRNENRSRAAASTTLYFMPATTESSPLVKNVNNTVDLDLYVDPGSNLVTFIRYQIKYDPTKLKIVPTAPITINNAVFTSVEGPVTSLGTIAQSVSIGSDPTKAIQQKTKVATLHFTAVGPTGDTSTAITFGDLTQALSIASGDQSSQNILSSTNPAYVQITGVSTITPGTTNTISPTISLLPSSSIAPSAIPTVYQTPTPTAVLSGTILSFTVVLHGVGIGGDNPNPSGNSLSNKNPIHPQRNLNLEVTDSNNNVVAKGSAPISFDSASGTFTGRMSLGNTIVSGNYNIKVKTDRYLRRLVPGIQKLTANQENQIATTTLIAGDTNGDNYLNVIDYNALLDCGYGQVNPLPMSDPNAPYNTQNCQAHDPAMNVDIDDNGIINSYDYNLFLRELSVQNGD